MTTDAPATKPVPDAGDLHPGDWPWRDVGDIATGQRLGGFQVVMTEPVLSAVRGHGRISTSREVGGVLVGSVFHDHLGAYLLVHAAIPAESTRADAAHVTFTADTWAAIHLRMDRDFPEDRIVGWYHTHPDFGIFLSEMDVFIQSNFFDLPWQVAFVYDPVRQEEGMFVWREGKPVREPIIVTKIDESDVTVGASPTASTRQPGTWFWVVFLVLVGLMLGALSAVEWMGLSFATPSDVSR